MKSCSINEIREYTERYTAPEILSPILSSEPPVIDLTKALSFSVGRMIHDLILRQVEKDLLELKVQVRKELERVSYELMQENPVGRMSLEEAVESFEKMEEEGNCFDLMMRGFEIRRVYYFSVGRRWV